MTLDRSPEFFFFFLKILSLCIFWKLAMLLVAIPPGRTIFVHKAIICTNLNMVYYVMLHIKYQGCDLLVSDKMIFMITIC